MNRFAALLDRLGYEPRRNAKLRLLTDYFRHTPDPDRGYALAAMTGALMFKEAKPGLIRGLVEERTDPELFRMSYHYVGDLAETVALIWPSPGHEVGMIPKSADAPSPPQGGREAASIGHNNPPPHVPTLTEVIEALATTSKSDLPARVAGWMDALDETGRWALIKLITRELRVGVSARLAKTAVAQLGQIEPDEVELVWHGLEAPYEDLFAWVEGRGERPESGNPAPFRPSMLSHPLEDEDFAKLDASEFLAEWKWDGIRLQAASGHGSDGRPVRRIYSRTGEDVSRAFPDLVEALDFGGAIDGELLIVREGRVQTFNVLQQRLNRKAVTQKLIAEFPAHLRVYDILFEGEEDLRALPFAERRKRLEALDFEGAIDGELLIVRDGRVQTFNVLQQRLNRKAVTQKLIAEFPAHLRVYDILFEGEEDLRALPFAERRKRLEALDFEGAIDGELLIVRDGRVQT
ncbi:MAG: cisplatin damage response ATP-dependent DNA ligase, partial [Microvirga sp.]